MKGRISWVLGPSSVGVLISTGGEGGGGGWGKREWLDSEAVAPPKFIENFLIIIFSYN